MTEPRRFQSPTGRLMGTESKPKWVMQHKTPTMDAYRRQSALYAQALFEAYQLVQPAPMGKSYAAADVAFTMDWWQQFAGKPVLVSRLRGRDSVLLSLNQMIRPETLAAMTPPTPRWCRCR